MVEARARIAACPGFECVDGMGDRWFDHATLETRIRLLRALLPSATELPSFTWDDDLEACSIEVKPQHLTRIEVWFNEEWSEVSTFSSKVLEAAPALETVAFRHHTHKDETQLA